MDNYGSLLVEAGRVEEGRQWMRKALELGYGDAGVSLSRSYAGERNAQKMIESLRAGAGMGSTKCLMRLFLTYRQGYYGQAVDEEYANCFIKLHDAIDEFDPPKPIKDFDKLCPPRPVQPYK